MAKSKKEIIVSTATRMFAQQGYHAVSTAKIAAKAGVSEGLIFKHFGTKQGLLEAIVAQLENRVAEIAGDALGLSDPREIIEHAILTLNKIPPKDYPFWKLQYKLKMDEMYNTKGVMQPYIDKISWALGELNVPKPALEAQLLYELVDSLTRKIVHGEVDQKEELVRLLLDKYLGNNITQS